MYPVRIDFSEVLQRINRLKEDGYAAEALVTSVFTLEKLMRRCMRLAIISRGFTSKHADHLLSKKGFNDLKEMWDVFDRSHRMLHNIIGQQVSQHVPLAVRMRNDLVHGNRVHPLAECDAKSAHVISALETLRDGIMRDYGCDPWAKLRARRTPRLSWYTRTEISH